MKWVPRAALVALSTFGLLIVVVGARDASQPGQLKLAYISSDQLLNVHPGYNAANATYAQAATAAQTRQQTMQDSIQGAIAAYQQARPALNDSVRGTREDGLNAMSQRFQQENQDLQDRLDALQDSLMAPMREQIVGVIEAVRNEDGYAFVFDLTNNSTGIVAEDKNLDITAKVATRVRALPLPRSSATTPPPAATPGRGGAAAPPATGRGGGTTPSGNGATGASPAGAGRTNTGRGGQ